MVSEFWGSLFSGLVQGLTEYLPVSSSGHLVLFQSLIGFEGENLAFSIVLHVATLFSTLLFFWKDICRYLVDFFSGMFKAESRKSEGWRYGWAVIAATVPTAVIGLGLKGFVESFMDSPHRVGWALLVTALLLVLSCFIREKNRQVNVKNGFVVGLSQGLAVIPGISRSGATIVTGLLCGLSKEEAFKFSFLASFPAILGATVLEFRHFSRFEGLPSGWWAGALVAFLSGLFALWLVKRLLLNGRWWILAVYCAVIGILALFM